MLRLIRRDGTRAEVRKSARREGIRPMRLQNSRPDAGVDADGARSTKKGDAVGGRVRYALLGLYFGGWYGLTELTFRRRSSRQRG